MKCFKHTLFLNVIVIGEILAARSLTHKAQILLRAAADLSTNQSKMNRKLRWLPLNWSALLSKISPVQSTILEDIIAPPPCISKLSAAGVF